MKIRKYLLSLLCSLLFYGISCHAESQTLTYSAKVPGLTQNPLKGFVPFAGNYSSFPHSMEWFYLPLRDVMQGPDTFDWTPLEKQLKDIASRGHQAAFRFYVDYPKRPTGIPQFLLDAGLQTLPYSTSGNATSVSPDYRDPRLIKAFRDFITALGARYDGDPRIGFITAGLYGFWGEWHVYPHPLPGESAGWKIAQADKDLLLKAYQQAFHKTIVMIRYGDATFDPQLQTAFGYHDDSFAWQTIGTRPSDFWTKIRATGLAEIWRTQPIGGEVYPPLQNALWDVWPNAVGQDVTASIATTHASWLMNSGVFKEALSTTQYANALRAHRILGYELYVSAVQLQTNADNSLSVAVTVENRGVAPFYYNWPVELALVDSSGHTLLTQATDWALRTVLPDVSGTQRWQTSIAVVPAKASQVLMRVVNPLANGRPLSFANTSQDATLPGWVTLGQLP